MATGKSSKKGRDAKKCAKYKAEGRREINKEKRIAKEAKRQERFRLRKEKKKEETKKEVIIEDSSL